ncbi:AraC family transcriptional regulator [Actinopolymorpha sp. B9G3]|uniref:AraC family transcriptional regulator n=1 Tax=Actinopolymorpha sp. B9G3 TaxID=3158970 RepID=UPI0032D8C6D3
MPASTVLRFEAHALGRPYHAAHVRLGPRAALTGPHRHADFYELMSVVDGRGEQHLETGTQPLAPGDIVLIRPHDEHAIAGRTSGGLGFVNVAFPADAWRAFVDLSHADPYGAWDRRAQPPLVSLTGEQATVMRTSFDRALARFHDAPTMRDLVRFWSEVVDLLCAGGAMGAGSGGGVGDGESGALEPGTRPGWLVRARAAMRRESNLRGGVPRLLELAGVSPAHLSRTMRGHYDTSPTRFVSDLRLERACTWLATTDLTVTEIAHRCGFASQSYFTRRFRQAEGLSPREFRARARRAFVP